MKKEEKESKKEAEVELGPIGNGSAGSGDKDIKNLLEKNLELNTEIFEMVRYIKRYIIWQKVWGFLKLLIIVIPIILAIFYLPPFLKGLYDNYKTFMEENLNIELPDNLNIGSVSGFISTNNISEEDMEAFSSMSEEERQKLMEDFNNMSEEEKEQAFKELNE